MRCLRLDCHGPERGVRRSRPHPAVAGLGPGAQPRPGRGGGAARRTLRARGPPALRGQRPARREPPLHGVGPGRGPSSPWLAPGAGAGRREAGRFRPDRPGGAFRPATPGVLPVRWAHAGSLDHDAGGHDRPLRRGHGLRRSHRHVVRDERRALHRPSLRGLRVGDGQTARRPRVDARARGRLVRLPCVQRQHLRRPAPLERRPAPCREPGPVAHGRGHGPALAGRVLGQAPGRSERPRTGAVPHAAAVHPRTDLSVRALRHRGARERARTRTGAPRREPSELFRRRGTRPRRPRRRATGSLPRQEGDLRRPGGRTDRPRHRRDLGRPRQRVGPAAAATPSRP